MFPVKKHYTAQSTQPEVSDKLNRYTFLEKSSAQLDEHYKKSKLIHEVSIPEEYNGVFSVRFNNEGDKLLASYGNGLIDVLDIDCSEFNYVIKDQSSSDNLPIMAVRCVPGEDETFFAAGISGNIYYCKFEQGNCRKFCEEKLNEINSIDIDISGTTLVSGGKDARLRLYDLRVGKIKAKYYKPNREPEDNSATNFHALRVFCVKYHSSEENIFLSGGRDDVLKIWDVRIRNGCVRNIPGPRICGEALDVRDKRILTGSWTVNNSLQLWDMSSGKLIENINPINRIQTLDGEFLYCCQFYKDGKHDYILAGGSGTSHFEIISLKELKIVSSYRVHKAIQTIDSNMNSTIAFGGMDPCINVLNVL
ncbi:hypothetical protein Trydic_g10481 [Trypoxylus dichotomus]